jgi:tetratricopeptide (TPR) repeat protein
MPMALLAEAAAKANDARRETQYRLRASLETYQLGLIRAGITHLERALELLTAQPITAQPITAQPITAQPTLATNDDLEMLYFKLTPIFRADVYSTPNLSGILEQLLLLARARGLTHFEALTLALQADVLASTTHNTDQARRLFAQALELVGTNLPVKATILELLAWCENTAGNTRLALRYANELLVLVVPLLDLSLEYRALEAVSIFEQNLCLWAAARDHALRAASVALQSQYARIGRPYMLTVVAHCALNLGDLEFAERHVRTALELYADSEWHNGLGFAKRTLAGILLEGDDLSQALEFARASVDHNEAIDQHYATFASLLMTARIEFAAGHAENALETLDRAEQVLARVSTLSVVTLAQGFLDAWRCIIKTQLGQPAINDALRSVQARAVQSQTNVSDSMTSWLLFPRETELEVLWNAGYQEMASREFEAFLQLHPDNPRIQILHDRARAKMLALNGEAQAAQTLLERTQQKSLELGFVMQARTIQAR